MRLVMPDRLIPASLDVDGIAGLESRLAAGANVVTSIVPPAPGLAGVSQSELDIDEGLRTAAEVTSATARRWGLRVATAGEYAGWVAASARQRRVPRVPLMRLAIVGGKLQGTEAAYLAGEAGYEVVLIDRRPDRPAAGLAAEVHVFDVTADPARAARGAAVVRRRPAGLRGRSRARVSDLVRAHDWACRCSSTWKPTP